MITKVMLVMMKVMVMLMVMVVLVIATIKKHLQRSRHFLSAFHTSIHFIFTIAL
jgi:hypothetical protein